MAGTVGALVLARWLTSLAFGISPSDPRILVAAAVVLTTTGLLAAWLPARRASRVRQESRYRKVTDARLVSRRRTDENVAAMERRGDYGYDAPYALVAFAAVGTACAIGAIVAWRSQDGHLARMLGVNGGFFLANAFSFLYTTTRGKFQVWNEVLDALHLRGDERVLDMGCGRGAVLTAVARRLKNGRVTGIDLWSTHDQSGNSRDVTLRNASLEGVSDRIDIETGDMRAMPFPDGSFDVVVSSLAIHNIRLHADRAGAIAEAWRVLKPGGRLAIADIRATARYAETLGRLGATGVVRRGLGWRFWYGNPFASTSLVTASKSARAPA